jgi:tetratricopeptide (TPR) repeat protein
MEEGVRLLNSGERQFGESAGPLAEGLGGLPLALELSKSYLNYRKDLTIPALLDEMKVEGEISILAEFATEYRDQLPSGHALDVASTFQMSWDVTSDPAKQLLRVMGELAPAPVPQRLLRTILKIPEQPALRDELRKSVNELARLSLVELDTKGDPVAHRLVLAFVRRRNVAENASPFDTCCEALQQQMARANASPDATANRELELLVPHAEFLAATDRLSPEGRGSLLSFVGIHNQTMGRFTAARHAFSRALASDEKSFEPGHPSIAIRQSNLALVLKDLGQLEEARDLLRQAYSASLERYGSGHPNTKTFKTNLERLPEQ